MQSNFIFIAAVAAALALSDPQPAAADDQALFFTVITCAVLQDKDPSVSCNVEFPGAGGPVIMVRFKNQKQAMTYGPLAVALFGPTVCNTIGDRDAAKRLRLALVDQVSGGMNVYSCADGSLGGWTSRELALRPKQ